MLRGDGISFKIAVVAFAPNGLKAACVQPWQELRPGSARHAMGRIQIVLLAQETAVVRRVPILAGIDAGPGQTQKPVDLRNDLQTAGYRQLARTERGKTLLNIDDQQGRLVKRQGRHVAFAFVFAS